MHCCRSNCIDEADESGFCEEHHEELERKLALERSLNPPPLRLDFGSFDEMTYDPREGIPVREVSRTAVRRTHSLVYQNPGRRT